MRYRVIPMIGSVSNLTKAAQTEWSEWTGWIVVGTGQTKGFDAFFNCGVVPAQWLASEANSSKDFAAMLKANINDPKPKNQIFLSGPLRTEMLARLEQARRDGVEIYAAI